MKTILVILTIIFSLTIANGQTKIKYNSRIDIDTLSHTKDSTFAIILLYRNDTLLEEKTGFLFSDSIRVPRFRLTGNLIKRTIYTIRVMSHGKTTEYTKDDKKKVTYFDHDIETNTLYLNKSNSEITMQEFQQSNTNWICGKKGNSYIIAGHKKY